MPKSSSTQEKLSRTKEIPGVNTSLPQPYQAAQGWLSVGAPLYRDDQALAVANPTAYGLSTAVLTRDIEPGTKVQRHPCRVVEE
jgi:hypothetical protein